MEHRIEVGDKVKCTDTKGIEGFIFKFDLYTVLSTGKRDGILVIEIEDYHGNRHILRESRFDKPWYDK